ncbi:MAG: hypothetical protein KF687_13925 [Cyclobacteriaceae bacterium]|nr:hypothetical protein [Cyclobacteriaceae bacterium]
MKAALLPLSLILIGITLLSNANAQTDYIILSKGDTLKGKVSYLGSNLNQRVQLTGEGKKKQVYEMLQVKAFQYNNEIYHLIRTTNRYTYMKLTEPGYLSLYAFQPENKQNWDGRYLFKRDGKGIEVPNIGFKKRMTDFLADDEELIAAIENGTLGRNDLSEIIVRYNTFINNKTQGISETYQKQQEATDKVGIWNTLEDAVNNSADLKDKEYVMEMIADAKAKVAKGDKLPRFIVDGLTKALTPHPELLSLLNEALAEKNSE